MSSTISLTASLCQVSGTNPFLFPFSLPPPPPLFFSCPDQYRPRLVRPGEPDVVCPIPIIAHGSGGGKGEAREGSSKGGVERGGHEGLVRSPVFVLE
eukprot:479040-Rhodomonas_salina.7